MATGRNHSSLTEKHAFMILNALPMVGSVLSQRLLERFNGDVISIFDRSGSDLMSVKVRGLAQCKRSL